MKGGNALESVGHRLARLLASLVLLACGLDLVGWAAAWPGLVTWLPGRPAMMPMTAVTFALLAGSVLLLSCRAQLRPRCGAIARVLAAIAIGMGGVVLMEYLIGASFAVDHLLFPDHVRLLVDDPWAGRTSPQSAVAVILLGSASVTFVENRTWRRLATWLAICAGVVAFVVISGLVYDVVWLYGVNRLIGMALPTSTCVVLLSLGMIALDPSEGLIARGARPSAAGLVLRSLLPVATLAPTLIGVILRWGELRGLWSASLSRALFLVLVVILLAVAVAILERPIILLEEGRVALLAERAVSAAERHKRHEIERTTRLRERFVSLAAHELRTPVTSMLLRVGQLERAREQGAAPEASQRHAVGAIRAQLSRFEQLTEAMVDVQEALAGNLEGAFEPLDATQLIQEATRASAERERATGRVVGDTEPPLEVCWDRSRIARMIDALVANAIVHGRSTAPVVEVSREGTELVVIHVVDHGPGIPSSMREDLLNAFTRGDESLAKVSEPGGRSGLGLGLFLADWVARLHRGSLRLEETPGGGTTAVVRLARVPLVRGSRTGTAAPAAPGRSRAPTYPRAG